MGTALVRESMNTNAPPEIFRHVAACLHDAAVSELVIPHALAIARAFRGRLTLFQLVQGAATDGPPADPLEWDIRCREAREQLEHLARECNGDVAVATDIVEGRAATQVHLWAERHKVDLLVLSSSAAADAADRALARTLVDQMPASVLIVRAPVTTHTSVGRYRRMLVPVDGSPRAESVLPLAARLASSAGSELLVAHVVPGPGLTEVGPFDSEDVDLQERIMRRNVRVATAYLDRVRARFATGAAPLRVMLVRDGDVRTRLERLVQDEGIDLVMLSSHGHSGRASVPYGSVTADLVLHSTVPVLIVRPRARYAPLTMAKADTRGRLPHQAAS